MTDKKKDYWYFDNEKIVHFNTLNKARANLFNQIKKGEKDGGVIFGPHSSGVMISDECGALWNGQRADQRPVREDGSLYPQNMVKELRGF